MHPPIWAKGIPPHDPHDASQWAPSYEVDCVHYELPPEEMAALEPAAIAAAEVSSPGRLRRRVYGPLRPFLAAEILARASGLCG